MAGGTTALKLRAEGFFGGGSVAENEAKTIQRLDVAVQQARAVVETSHAWQFAGGGSLTPALEVGGRYDGGDGETGIGLEVGGGVTWADPGSGLTVAAGGPERRAAARPERGRPRPVAARAAGLGRDRERRRRAVGAWRRAPARLRAGRRPAGRVEAEIGYGLPALGLTGVLTPFARVALSDAGARSLSLGGRLALAAAFDLTLEAKRTGSADPKAPPRHDLTLEGSSRW